MGFPQLIEEDLVKFDLVLGDLVKKSEAMLAMIVEKAGYLIHQFGNTADVDSVTFATLGSNAFNATRIITKFHA